MMKYIPEVNACDNYKDNKKPRFKTFVFQMFDVFLFFRNGNTILKGGSTFAHLLKVQIRETEK